MKSPTIDELRQSIVEASMGTITIDELEKEYKGKGAKDELINILNTMLGDEETSQPVQTQVETAEMDAAEWEAVLSPESNIPAYTSPDWPEYVMKNFTDDELDDGNPNINGLRRVSQLVLGPILISRPLNPSSNLDNESMGRASCAYEVTFHWFDGTNRTFGGFAGAWEGNTDNDFQLFPEAMAETRAEGRALRKALNITKVCADELTSKDADEVSDKFANRSQYDTSEPTGLIEDNQVNVINHLCNRLGISVEGTCTLAADRDIDNIRKLTKAEGAATIKLLSRYQSKDENSLDIPEELKV